MNFGGLDTNKAGLQKANITEINSVIFQETTGSARDARINEKSSILKKKSELLLQRLSNLSEHELRKHTQEIDDILAKEITSATQEGFYNRIVAVVDFDCFYASVEARDNPACRGKPLVVGGGGIVSAASYEARKFGIRSAMPLHIAKKLCPELIIKHGDISKYVQISRAAGKIYQNYDPKYILLSVDEVYLDLTEYIKNLCKAPFAAHKFILTEIGNDLTYIANNTVFELGYTNNITKKICSGKYGLFSMFFTEKNLKGSPTSPSSVEMIDYLPPEIVAAAVVFKLRKDIYRDFSLTCSAGVSYSRQISKIATDLKKPNGQTICKLLTQNFSFDNREILKKSSLSHFLNLLEEDNSCRMTTSELKDLLILEVRECGVNLLHRLPLRKIYGIGPMTAEMLNNPPFSIITIGDLFERRGMMSALLAGKKTTKNLVLSSIGLQRFETDFFGKKDESNLNMQSIGQQMTFPETLDDEELKKYLLSLCQGTSKRMNKHGVVAKRITTKARFADWKEATHVCDLARKSSDIDVLFNASFNSLKRMINEKRKNDLLRGSGISLCQVGFEDSEGSKKERQTYSVRLIGISATELEAMGNSIEKQIKSSGFVPSEVVLNNDDRNPSDHQLMDTMIDGDDEILTMDIGDNAGAVTVQSTKKQSGNSSDNKKKTIAEIMTSQIMFTKAKNKESKEIISHNAIASEKRQQDVNEENDDLVLLISSQEQVDENDEPILDKEIQSLSLISLQENSMEQQQNTMPNNTGKKLAFTQQIALKKKKILKNNDDSSIISISEKNDDNYEEEIYSISVLESDEDSSDESNKKQQRTNSKNLVLNTNDYSTYTSLNLDNAVSSYDKSCLFKSKNQEAKTNIKKTKVMAEQHKEKKEKEVNNKISKTSTSFNYINNVNKNSKKVSININTDDAVLVGNKKPLKTAAYTYTKNKK